MRLVELGAYVVGGLVLVGCGSSSGVEDAIAPPSSPSSPSPTSSPNPTRQERPPRPEPGEVVVDGLTIGGEWEDGELLGEQLELPGGQVLYAVRKPDLKAVLVGLRDGDRILRLIQALTPEAVREPDGIDLYGGDVLGERGPDERVADGSYRVFGSVPGDVEVWVSTPGGGRQPVTGSSTEMLPGFTVFYVEGTWKDGWDQVQLAPLTVTTSNDRSVDVRRRSWTG